MYEKCCKFYHWKNKQNLKRFTLVNSHSKSQPPKTLNIAMRNDKWLTDKRSSKTATPNQIFIVVVFAHKLR